MKTVVYLTILLLLAGSVAAQRLSPHATKAFLQAEDSLKVYARDMIVHPNSSKRFEADSIFIRQLVRSLRSPNSFYYPYDSLETVSRIYAPDSTFRIFTWQFNRDDQYFRQRGAIQMRTTDGSLKLFPLLDMSEFMQTPEDSVRAPNNWVGAIYYGLVKKSHNGKDYYTLIGFDDNSDKSTKKWIDVLSFNANGQPQFGGPFFNMSDVGGKAIANFSRFSIEYKKDGRARMNYDPEMDMIVYDHLVSENNTPDKKSTLVPDGDYEGFKWVDGRWQHVDKVFDFKLRDGQAPLPKPLKDATGTNNEQQLLEQSQKNAQKKKP